MTLRGTEFQTVQPVCTGIARSMDEWGLQRRIQPPADTVMELKLIKLRVLAMFSVLGMWPRCSCFMRVAKVLSLSYTSRVRELGEMRLLAGILAVQAVI